MIILLCGTQAIGQEISDSLRIHFQQSKSLFNESVAGNSQFYGSLADLLEMAKRKDVEIVSITVYGAASPEGGITIKVYRSGVPTASLLTLLKSEAEEFRRR